MLTNHARTLLRTTSVVALFAGAGSGALAQTTTINGGGGTSPAPTYAAEFAIFQAAKPQYAFNYVAIGASTAQTAFLTNNATLLGLAAGTPVDFAASDQPLNSTQVSGYTLASQDGPLAQFPTFGVGVTIPFRNSKLTKGTQLQLTDAQLCGIFSGALSNWSQISSKAAAGPVTVVYRADGSAATYLLTEHLAAVCSPSQFSGTLAATSTFTTLFATGTPPSNFTGVSKSSGVQATLLAATSAIGYISPDYTSIAPHSATTSSLIVASLVNSTNHIAYQPTTADITTGLANPVPGSTNPTPPSTQVAAANPLNWVPLIPDTKAGYSIVGYTSWVVSTCYANAAAATGIKTFLNDHFSIASYKTAITNNGNVPLVNSPAAKFVTAIKNDFLTNNSKFNLNIQNKTVCTGKPGR
jgi:ABC-type phosphate transport system substrate-binding protein